MVRMLIKPLGVTTMVSMVAIGLGNALRLWLYIAVLMIKPVRLASYYMVKLKIGHRIGHKEN